MQERCLLGDIEFFRCECCGESRAFIQGNYYEPNDLVVLGDDSLLAAEVVWDAVEASGVSASECPPLVVEFLRAGLADMQALVDALARELGLPA